MGWNDRMNPQELKRRFPKVYEDTYGSPSSSKGDDVLNNMNGVKIIRNEAGEELVCTYCNFCGDDVFFSKTRWEEDSLTRDRPMHNRCILAKWG